MQEEIRQQFLEAGLIEAFDDFIVLEQVKRAQQVDLNGSRHRISSCPLSRKHAAKALTISRPSSSFQLLASDIQPLVLDRGIQRAGSSKSSRMRSNALTTMDRWPSEAN